MKQDLTRTKFWTRKLTLSLARTSDPPIGVEARVGKGLHLLLKSGSGKLLVVSFTPYADGMDGYARSKTSVMRYIGEHDPGQQESEWLECLKASWEKVERDENWKAFLELAMARPAVSLPAEESKDRITSGHASLIRVCTRCNAQCDFCSARGVLPDLVEQKDAIRERIGSSLGGGSVRVSFTGGEPTLRKDLPELLAMARDLGAQDIDLQTNGILLARKQVLEPLVEAGLSSIFLSLHSADRTVHDAMLGVEGAFDKAVSAALLCKNKGIMLNVNCVLTSSNLEGAADLVGFISKRFGNDTHLNLSFVALQGWALEHPELIPRLSVAAPYMIKALDMGATLDLDVRVPGLCGVPLCILPGYEERFDEFHDSHPPLLPTRSFVPACRECPYRQLCSGFWTAYFERFGDSEIGFKSSGHSG